MALYGKFKGRALYFDVLSGKESDDLSENRYRFDFGLKEEMDKLNEECLKKEDRQDDDFPLEYWVDVRRVFAMRVRDRQDFVKQLTSTLHLDVDDELRIKTNLDQFIQALTVDENIMKSSVIDENRPSQNPERKSEADVLEIFVRINRQGTALNRSDLIFSMLKLSWKESAEALPEFVQRIKEGNSFNLNSDFVIRCLFAVCDFGAKFDIELLRTKSNVEKMKSSFSRCCDAIASTVDFVQKECWCSNSEVIGGTATLVPFVYYLFGTKRLEVPNSQIGRVRKAFYLFAFAKPFSRYGESRLGNFTRHALKPLVEETHETFPFEGAVQWVAYWERVKTFDEELLHRNPLLALHVVQHSTGAKTHYQPNAPEVDHIFPRSELRGKGVSDHEINHPANYWILPKGKNINKSNKHPAKYFDDVDDRELRRALIVRDMLDYRKYKTFLTQRTESMLSHISKTVGLSADDSATLERT